MVFGFLWQRMRDSNPRKRSQSPVCYRYTNPLCVKHGYHYTERWKKVKYFFPIFSVFFTATKISMPITLKAMQNSGIDGCGQRFAVTAVKVFPPYGRILAM